MLYTDSSTSGEAVASVDWCAQGIVSMEVVDKVEGEETASLQSFTECG